MEGQRELPASWNHHVQAQILKDGAQTAAPRPFLRLLLSVEQRDTDKPIIKLRPLESATKDKGIPHERITFYYTLQMKTFTLLFALHRLLGKVLKSLLLYWCHCP